jgi:hypothetical protein
MGYVTQSRTNAAGGRLDTGGSVSKPVVDMARFGFGSEHSAEWEFTIEQTHPFWEQIMSTFGIDSAE